MDRNSRTEQVLAWKTTEEAFKVWEDGRGRKREKDCL